MKKSQHEKILQQIKIKWLSPLDALKLCGTMKLSTRISELKDMGYNIVDKWDSDRRFKLYRLASKQDLK